ncbi:MAG: biotin--[acetyl-CoA-carboxylase] ligase [Anaerolineales bacterium]|nr:biotin--[acetyl-CoA-carboxylase] ligase [Anaerolineales bacterium]
MTLKPEELERRLPVVGLGRPLYFFTSIGSTNDYAKELAEQGAPHGTLIVADEQTAGRGRAGKSWSTPASTALALSLLVRDEGIKPRSAASLNGVAALSVAQAIEARGGQVGIKWPNDVYVQGKKVAGVLVETAWEGDRLAHAVIGVGVNVHRGSAPPDDVVEVSATDLETVLGRKLNRTALLVDILRASGRWLEDFGTDKLFAAWQARLMYRDQWVSVGTREGELQGELLGLSPDGKLRLRMAEGDVRNMGTEARGLRALDEGSK